MLSIGCETLLRDVDTQTRPWYPYESADFRRAEDDESLHFEEGRVEIDDVIIAIHQRQSECSSEIRISDHDHTPTAFVNNARRYEQERRISELYSREVRRRAQSEMRSMHRIDEKLHVFRQIRNASDPKLLSMHELDSLRKTRRNHVERDKQLSIVQKLGKRKCTSRFGDLSSTHGGAKSYSTFRSLNLPPEKVSEILTALSTQLQ